MTIQEANALVDDFSFVYKGNSISKEMLIECREVIHKSLEKQIPKKLKTIEVGLSGLVFLCPSCENEIAMMCDSVWQKGKYKQKCCDNCGQALDFGDLSLG